MDIDQKAVVITGGAQGLGLAMAQRFGRQGARLALIDREPSLLSAAVEQLEAEGISAKGYEADVVDEAGVESTFERIASDFGGIDGLINNAGILRDGMLLKAKNGQVTDKMSLAKFQSVIDVNLTGVFLCGREAAAQMVKGGRPGVIVNMSSVARAGNIGQTNYAAAKAGVVAMTVTWARELGRFGIRVGAIAPGVIRTAMTDAMRPEMRERLEKLKPVGRLGEPDEIAHTAAYIFENDFFTGRVVEVDGGICF
jgi:3-oxoacyl-[acyl-carrier protein] reductase